MTDRLRALEVSNVARSDRECEIVGCVEYAQHTLARPSDGSRLRVCRKCRGDLVEVFGYRRVP